MSEFSELLELFGKLGIVCRVDFNTYGWGHPEYTKNDSILDFPPDVILIDFGYSSLYFDIKDESFIGWYDSEGSKWHPRRKIQ